MKKFTCLFIVMFLASSMILAHVSELKKEMTAKGAFTPNDENPVEKYFSEKNFNNSVDGDFTYDFEGTDYAECGVMPLSGSEVTIEAWVNVDVFQSAFPYISTIAGTETGIDHLCLLRIGDDGLEKEKPQFILTIGGTDVKLNANTSLSANTWHHLAATYDGSNMKIYIDGVEDASMVQSGDFISNDEFYISYSYGGRYIDGSIDELRVWNIARTEAEIIEYSCNIPDPMNEPGLVAYYKFNNPDDIVLLDETGNYDALIVNQTGSFEESGACPGDYYSATFHVTTDGVGLEGAEVAIGILSKFTDSNGEAVFELIDGEYSYIVTKEGFVNVEGLFTISGEDITVEVEMQGPHFEFEGGDPSSPLWTIYISEALSNGEDLVADDQIAIFDGDLMVGLITLEQICTPENQFENDLTAFSVLVSGQGYQSGNSYSFKCWDASEDIVVENFEIELFNPYGDAYTGDVFPSGDGEYSIVAFDFISSGTSQTFDLSIGFQFISTSVIPENTNMLSVIEEILNDNLDFVRNSQGQTLRKIGPNWVNGIGDWMIDEGYLVKMYANDSFTINGTLVDPTTPIPLETGFQFVSYFPESSMDALEAFETIIGDNLDFIRNSQGQTLRKIGPIWVNGIGNCQSGEGYLVKMFAEGVLIYPGSSSFTCGDPFFDPRDEQTYNTVQIGNQCWMAENLNIGEMINGSEEMTNNGIIEKYCYDNNISNCDEYGGFYQWNEMMEYVSDTATQGICPEGWHLPTDNEWKVLEGTADTMYPVGSYIWSDQGWRGFNAGLNLKSTTGWNSGGNGTDAFGFTALPGGARNQNGSFEFIMIYTSLWSSSENGSSYAWYRCLGYAEDGVGRYFQASKNFGRSVRCLRDYSKFNTDGQSHVDNLSVSGNGRPNELSGKKHKNNVASYFLFEGGNPAEAVYSIYIKGLEIGDEIAAYDGDKMVGALKVNSDETFDNELPVFSTLINGQGYESGNPITLKVWSENKLVPTEFTMEAIYDSYVSDVYPDEDGKYSVVNISKGKMITNDEIIIYPNPANDLINIISPIEIVSISIYNNAGQIVYQGAKTQINVNDFESGVYFIRISNNKEVVSKKLLIE